MKHISEIKKKVRENKKMSYEVNGRDWDFWSYRMKNKRAGICIGCDCVIDLKVDICSECTIDYELSFYKEMDRIDKILNN